MLKTALTVSQLFGCRNSIAAFSDSEAAEGFGCLLTGEAEASEALYKITGFSSAANNDKPTGVGGKCDGCAVVCANTKDDGSQQRQFLHSRPESRASGSSSPEVKLDSRAFIFDIPDSVKLLDAFKSLGFSLDPEDLAREFPADPLKGRVFKIPRSHDEANWFTWWFCMKPVYNGYRTMPFRNFDRRLGHKAVFDQELEDGRTYSGFLNDDGKPHSEGRVTCKCGDSYEGEICNGVSHGLGRYCLVNGDESEGLFNMVEHSCRGIYKYNNSNSKYYGTIKHFQQQGKGVFEWYNGCVYIGYFKNGKRSGKGIQKNPSGFIYVGDFKNDKFMGLPSGAKKMLKRTITRACTEEEKGTICCICSNNFSRESHATVFPCSHIFHVGCAMELLKSRRHCPTCQQELFKDEASTA